jgi:uncharacterized repeat protein (TIGR04076 family)
MAERYWASKQNWGHGLYELKITVTKVMGACTANPPMKAGDHFVVRDGDIEIPEGGYVCLWALQSLLPLITPKEREISEKPEDDWMWRVHHAQCPDPKGRVIFTIEQVRKIDSKAKTDEGGDALENAAPCACPSENGLKSLRITVESVSGHCTSRMKPGDHFDLRSGRLTIPAGRRICLYALQAVLPLLPAKQRATNQGDWLNEECRVLCPDPAGNVILRIDAIE